MHGDHCYGLPGILTSRGLMSGAEGKISIYGPKGIKKFIETILKLSHARLRYDILYHEFTQTEMIYEDEFETIHCVKLSHDVPSFSFVFDEKDRPGSFDAPKAQAAGITPGPLYGQLTRGEKVTLEDGRIFDGKDFIGPSKKGPKVIIGGDNDSPELLNDYLINAEVFVHESTHTTKVKKNLTWTARHSTAASVATVAEAKGVKNLVLTHFSPRYSSKVDKGSDFSICRIEEEAENIYSGNLIMAQDFDCLVLNKQGELSIEKRGIR